MKCQAFVKEGGKKLGIEIVTFEEWIPVAHEVLKEVGQALEDLQKKADEPIFDYVGEAKQQSLEDFEGVM